MRISDWSSDVCSSDLHGVSEIIRNRDDVAFTIDISNVQAPANSILHEFSVEFSSQVELKKYELVGTRKLRSEEHTSELQSLMRISYAVFCLKKKNTKKHTKNI